MLEKLLTVYYATVGSLIFKFALWCNRPTRRFETELRYLTWFPIFDPDEYFSDPFWYPPE